MKKNNKRKKTSKYAQKQYWSTMMMVDDELVEYYGLRVLYVHKQGYYRCGKQRS